MAESPVPQLFVRDPNLSLVNTSWLSSFSISTIYSYLTSYTTGRHRQAVVTLKILNSPQVTILSLSYLWIILLTLNGKA